MARSNIEGATISDNILLRANKIGMTTVRSTGTTVVLGANISDYIEIKLSAAAGIRLPAASAQRGRRISFINTSSGTAAATLKTSTGGALAVAATVQKNKTKSVISNGTLWYPENAAST